MRRAPAIRAKATMSGPAIDLLDLRHYAEGPPHEQLRWLRRHAPVFWHPESTGPGFWAITRYDDVVQVSRDTTFSSHAGGTMIDDPPPAFLAGMQLMMLNMDPPQHTKLRALVNKGFTPRMVVGLEGRVRDLARQIVDAVVERETFDFVTDVAGELPSYVIAELVGIPLADGRRLYALTERMHTATPTPEGLADGQGAFSDMMAYATALREAKATRPGADLASALLAAEIDGQRLSDVEFNLFFMLLINAGGDTTRNLVAGGMLALLRHPAALAALRADPALVPSAIEEMLRYQSPVQHFRRTATRDATIRGQPIAAGQKVVVFYTAANRDESRFPEPDRFDVARAPNEHLAFGGGGTHYCLGANLARLEIRAMFDEVLARLDGLELAGPVEWLASTFINGPRRMPVRRKTPARPG
jgi:cytochrome P450